MQQELGFRELFDATPEALVIYDLNARVVDVNQQLCALLGIDRDFALNQVAGALSEGDPAVATAEAARLLRLTFEEGPRSFEWKIKPRHREAFWAEIALRRAVLAGTPRVVASIRDVSDRHRAEEELRRKEDRLAALTAISTEGIMVHENGVILDCNPAFARLVGAPSPESLVGRPGLEALRLTPASRQRIIESMRKDSSERFDVEVERSDGSVMVAETWGRKSTYQDRNVRLVYFLDVSERRRADEEARLTARRLSLALTATADAVWEWNPITGQTYYSPRAYEILGYRDQEFPMTFEAFERFCHPDDFGPVTARIDAAIKGDGHYQTEFRMRSASGDWVWILGRGAVVERDAAGQPVLMAGTNTDITERKRAEQERQRLEDSLLQAQKMESVGRLAGGVAHDFNNLLTTILVNITLALNELSPDDELRELLLEVERAGTSAAELTRQLLAFSRKQVIEPRVLRLNDIVEGLTKLLSRLLGEDLKVTVSLAPDLLPVKVDAAQMEQVIVNLCVNARDAMPSGGKLTIETVNVYFDEEYCAGHPGATPGPGVMLAVSDTGQGMNPEVLSRLFEPFFTTKGPGKGTGLGLAMVYGAVKQNKGRIEVYSEPGQGTTFKVYLPSSDGAPEALGSLLPVTVPTGSEHIVLVEDQPALRNVAVRLLTRLGYRVSAFQDGNSALAALPTLTPPPALLFTDVVMPDMNGKRLAERARALVPSLPVLYTSGYTDNVVVHHGVLDEGVEFVSKPYSMQSLATRIRQVLDGTGR